MGEKGVPECVENRGKGIPGKESERLKWYNVEAMYNHGREWGGQWEDDSGEVTVDLTSTLSILYPSPNHHFPFHSLPF